MNKKKINKKLRRQSSIILYNKFIPGIVAHHDVVVFLLFPRKAYIETDPISSSKFYIVLVAFVN